MKTEPEISTGTVPSNRLPNSIKISLNLFALIKVESAIKVSQ